MTHVLFKTLPGRAIVIGAAVKAVVFAIGLVAAVPRFLGVIDTVASVAVAGGGVYFVGQGLAFANRRLLWRVRRKLIISYIFIGFIPSILIVAFFVLGGFFLFSNFSSYLVQSEFRTLEDRAMSIASALALDVQRGGRADVRTILRRRQAIVATEFPGVSMAAVAMNRPCVDSSPTSIAAPLAVSEPRTATAGPWAHIAPPTALPDWLGDCSGFSGLLLYGGGAAPSATTAAPVTLGASSNDVGLIARAVSFTNGANPGYGVIVDIVIDDRFRQQLRSETGVHLTTVQPRAGEVQPLAARSAPAIGSRDAAASTLPLMSVAFLEDRDWTTGARGAALASGQLSIPDIYRRISTPASGGENFSQGLLVVLLAIGILFLIIQAMALVTGLALARSITGSVHELFAGTERVRQGDFTNKIAIRAHDQLGELAQSFNSMTASIEDLLREQAEKKRLEEELRIAHEIQMSLLPQGPLRIPGLSVTAICVPAREVGGDYYDFFPLDDHRVGILIADVSGKGTSAALYMAELKGLMLSLSRIHTSPRDLLIMANRIIAEHLDARSFITMTYAVLDLQARMMTYARAGHTPLIYLPATGSNRALRVLAPDGLVLGLKIDNGEMFEHLLHEETIALHEGDLFVLFTDGITEAMDASDDCFGEARLGRLIEEHSHLPAEELRERVLREIAAFVGHAPQHDDMTMLLIRIGSPTPHLLQGAEMAAAEVQP
jgi:sigma-B regulation protein RsbU (phosphoserine phosphatase)